MPAWLCALDSLVLPAVLGASQIWFLAQDTRGRLVGALVFCLGTAGAGDARGSSTLLVVAGLWSGTAIWMKRWLMR